MYHIPEVMIIHHRPLHLSLGITLTKRSVLRGVKRVPGGNRPEPSCELVMTGVERFERVIYKLSGFRCVKFMFSCARKDSRARAISQTMEEH